MFFKFICVALDKRNYYYLTIEKRVITHCLITHNLAAKCGSQWQEIKVFHRA